MLISLTGIDLNLSRLLEAIGLNRAIKDLKIGQNFEGKGRQVRLHPYITTHLLWSHPFCNRVEGMRQLCRLVQSPECSLQLLSIANSKLKELTSPLLNSLIPNDSIKKLDIR